MRDTTPAATPEAWTRDHLADRLVAAFRTLDRLPRDLGPRRPGNHWPRHRVEFADAVAQAELPQEEREARARQRLAVRIPTGREIDHMDRAIDWLRELRGADPDLAAALTHWALCTARRRSVRKLCREKGWVPASFYLWRARALDLLAATLNARGVAVF